ncbi:MAG: nucleotidyl transferase AbiEii/AbiGii toxin family protein [Chlamydiae bacterium]|nr:nucleotidyl transferase AbiEii/AbiGii toxin family protein [Chlamydiota bacterium]MBI3276442.1 nucleotidyl transferase AbiEii/AbiGii toxin family protein [Chlamydiota bacterium]
MNTYSHLQAVELFHLIFLRHVGENLDKGLYALKGGCNLRFFMKSIRYSEDLDIDIQTVAKDTLERKIGKILNSKSLHHMLNSRGIELNRTSTPKQTETTQRWKILLKVEGKEVLVPTKIEFSRRTLIERTQFEPIDPEMIQFYKLYPVLVNHYSKTTAFAQKLHALSNRNITQARDIFDLKLLIEAGAIIAKEPFHLQGIDVQRALENAKSLRWEDFKGQVLAYLAHEYQEYYSKEIWEKLHEEVLREIEKLKL